jgi:GntR family transcriptional repressor for pyruvate dehydrogenase complex
MKPIRPRNISDQVYEQLRDMIYRGELPPGQRLMPERDLASFFKVSRSTIRSAIQRLLQQGLVESRRSSGTFVIEENQTIQHNHLFRILNKEAFTIVEFQEVRMGLETISAEMAAKRATDEDIRMIKQSLERMANERIQGNIKMKTDLSFHMNIAYASKNIVQIHLMKSFYDVQIFAMSLAWETLFSTIPIEEEIEQDHHMIFEAICNHDPEQASKSMKDHISRLLVICRENNL